MPSSKRLTEKERAARAEDEGLDGTERAECTIQGPSSLRVPTGIEAGSLDTRNGRRRVWREVSSGERSRRLASN